MRTKLIAGNWKMNLSGEQAEELTQIIVNSISENGPDVLLCPSFTLIAKVRELVKDTAIALGAQNLFWEEKGAYTGEVSADMIIDAGCTHVLIGHSERRQYFGETDATVRRKTATALSKNLIPVVCVGETLEEREEGRTESVIEHQVSRALERFKAEEVSRVILAYEPVWAIGSGLTATPETAQEVHQQIRSWLKSQFGNEVSDNLRILYGGSVKGSNASSIFEQKDIDGGLIGGASLKAPEFMEIINAAR